MRRVTLTHYFYTRCVKRNECPKYFIWYITSVYNAGCGECLKNEHFDRSLGKARIDIEVFMINRFHMHDRRRHTLLAIEEHTTIPIEH